MDKAIERAKRIEKYHKENGIKETKDMNPVTQVYLIIESLNKTLKDT